LATNDHISSSWISRVSGGKGHELVVDAPGVLPGHAAQPHDGVAVDADEAFGLADAAALDQVLEDRDGLLRRQAGVEQRGALAFGESGVARLAVEQADMPLLSIAITDREVAGIASAVERADRVEAAEAREIVVHRSGSSRWRARRAIMDVQSPS
jgi:hypothetical protein